jgi:hypothetical protein
MKESETSKTIAVGDRIKLRDGRIGTVREIIGGRAAVVDIKAGSREPVQTVYELINGAK